MGPALDCYADPSQPSAATPQLPFNTSTGAQRTRRARFGAVRKPFADSLRAMKFISAPRRQYFFEPSLKCGGSFSAITQRRMDFTCFFLNSATRSCSSSRWSAAEGETIGGVARAA